MSSVKKSGHIISNCFKLKRKQETEGSSYPHAFIKKYTKERVFASSKIPTKQEPKQNPLLERYKPFLSKGRVAINAGCYKHTQILRDMGASQTLLLESVLLLLKATFTGNMVLQGVELETISAPFHHIHIVRPSNWPCYCRYSAHSPYQGNFHDTRK